LTGSPGKSQKEGQEDQGTLKQLGGSPLSILPRPGPPGHPSGSSLGSLSIHQTALSYSPHFPSKKGPKQANITQHSLKTPLELPKIGSLFSQLDSQGSQEPCSTLRYLSLVPHLLFSWPYMAFKNLSKDIIAFIWPWGPHSPLP
jgi:hypothetical protein